MRTCDDGLCVPGAEGVDVVHSLVQTSHDLQRQRAVAVLMLGGGRLLQIPNLLHSFLAAQHCDARLVQLLLQQQSLP